MPLLQRFITVARWPVEDVGSEELRVVSREWPE